MDGHAARDSTHQLLSSHLPRLPLGRQRGNNALPGQPQQLRLTGGINANLSCVLLDLWWETGGKDSKSCMRHADSITKDCWGNKNSIYCSWINKQCNENYMATLQALHSRVWTNESVANICSTNELLVNVTGGLKVYSSLQFSIQHKESATALDWAKPKSYPSPLCTLFRGYIGVIIVLLKDQLVSYESSCSHGYCRHTGKC